MQAKADAARAEKRTHKDAQDMVFHKAMRHHMPSRGALVFATFVLCGFCAVRLESGFGLAQRVRPRFYVVLPWPYMKGVFISVIAHTSIHIPDG